MEPEPPKRSSTVSPSLELDLIARAHKASGFGEAWPPVNSLSSAEVRGKCQTLVIRSCVLSK